MHMRNVTALAPYERTILAGHFTRKPTSSIGDSTDPTYVALGYCVIVAIARIASPLHDSTPVLDMIRTFITGRRVYGRTVLRSD